MHPAMIYWWKNAQRAAEAGWGAHPGCAPRGSCGVSAGCGPGFSASPGGADDQGDFGGGSFGVRRPLRFLAYKLDLRESQVGELAKILNDLKTERAQAEVDRRRTLSAFADAVASEAFDDAKAKEGGGQRVKTAEGLRDAVVNALKKIHAILDADQREQLAYLIRTGVLAI